MELPFHSIENLFVQLGLDPSDSAIDAFINRHGPLAQSIKLHEASSWTENQAQFLKAAKEEDADWAEVVDELDVMLRKP